MPFQPKCDADILSYLQMQCQINAVTDVVRAWKGFKKQRINQKIFSMCITAIKYNIWTKRNARSFKAKAQSAR